MLNAANTVDIYRANVFVRRCSRVEAAGYIQNLVSRGYGATEEYVISDAAALAAEVTAWISAWDKVEYEIRERNPGLKEERTQEMTECVMRQAIKGSR